MTVAHSCHGIPDSDPESCCSHANNLRIHSWTTNPIASIVSMASFAVPNSLLFMQLCQPPEMGNFGTSSGHVRRTGCRCSEFAAQGQGSSGRTGAATPTSRHTWSVAAGSQLWLDVIGADGGGQWSHSQDVGWLVKCSKLV